MFLWGYVVNAAPSPTLWALEDTSELLAQGRRTDRSFPLRHSYLQGWENSEGGRNTSQEEVAAEQRCEESSVSPG